MDIHRLNFLSLFKLIGIVSSVNLFQRNLLQAYLENTLKEFYCSTRIRQKICCDHKPSGLADRCSTRSDVM